MTCQEHNPEQVAGLYNQAVTLANEGESTEATKILEHLLENHQECVNELNLRYYLGLCFYNIDDNQKADEYLTEVCKQITPDTDDKKLLLFAVLRILSNIRFEDGMYEDALEYLNEGAEYISLCGKYGNNANCYNYYLSKGRCYMFMWQNQYGLENLKCAETFLNKMVSNEFYLENINILRLELGRAYLFMDNIEDAWSYLSQINRSDLPSAGWENYNYLWLRILFLRGEYQSAIVHFKECEADGVRKSSENESYYFVGRAYFALGELTEAKRLFALVTPNPEYSDWAYEKSLEYLEKIKTLRIKRTTKILWYSVIVILIAIVIITVLKTFYM